MSGAPVDFTGTWLKTDVEGNPDAFLKEVGWSYLGRTAAKAMGYGKGKQRHIIKQEGNSFNLENITPQKTMKKTILVDGSEQDDVDFEGNPIRVTPCWEGKRLQKSGFAVFACARSHLHGRIFESIPRVASTNEK